MAGGSERTPTEKAVNPGEGYAGDVAPKQAWQILAEEPDAILVDVRTQPEWVFVGIPDLSTVGKRPAFIPWQVYPTMAQNPEFLRQIAAAGAKQDRPVLFLCRSGGRSRAAAIAATGQGFTRAYNIIGGFEGPLDATRHRGAAGGWKADGLPWLQD
ncbi:MAG: rhodanese-like domain-containing protein [Gemmatimonas sp.]